MTIPEARDRLLDAMLAHIPDKGWSRAALQAGMNDLGVTAEPMETVFPLGPQDALIHFSERADQSMSVIATSEGFEELRLHQSVEQLVIGRLEALLPYREAVRRGIAYLALPPNVMLGLRLLSRTVDETWYLAGDRSSDFSYYTKRAILAAVISSTTVCWLDDDSEDMEATRTFLSRRLAGTQLFRRVRDRVEYCNSLAGASFRGVRSAFDKTYGRDTFRDNRVT